MAGALFQHAVIGFGDLAFGASGENLGSVVHAAAAAPLWKRWLVPVLGGIGAGFAMWAIGRVMRRPADAGGAGIADVMQMLVKGGNGPSMGVRRVSGKTHGRRSVIREFPFRRFLRALERRSDPLFGW